VLFIDRLAPTAKLAARDKLSELEIDFASRREVGEIPSDEEIFRRLEELERLRT
jgi:peptide deformylase